MTDQLPALMFNAVGPALGDWWVPMTTRKAIADALYALALPELQQLRRCVPLICSDERHTAKVATLEAENEQLRAALNGAYRERAQLLAELTTRYPAVLAPAPDVDEPGWTLLYLTLPTGQASWHQHPDDYGLFGHVERVQADDPRARWDGHTTEEKYRRVADAVALAQQAKEDDHA